MMLPTDAPRRIAAERILLLAWPRAILLQLAHPLIASGVAAHSSFRGNTRSAFSRLHHTVGAMLALTFGTEREREGALEGIRAIHRRVNGTLADTTGPFAAGTRYSAEDPELLTWVHVTLAESTIRLYGRLVAPLTEADRDRYCAESAGVAVALGARASEVPRSWQALVAYADAQYASGRVIVGRDARTVASALLVNPLLSSIAIGDLPSAIRQQYGFRWSAAQAKRFERIMRTLRCVRRITPRPLATWRAARRVNDEVTGHARTAAAPR